MKKSTNWDAILRLKKRVRKHGITTHEIISPDRGILVGFRYKAVTADLAPKLEALLIKFSQDLESLLESESEE